MILILKILLHNEYKIINLWYPRYVYQFFNFPYNYKNRVLACFQTRPSRSNLTSPGLELVSSARKEVLTALLSRASGTEAMARGRI